ncbi:hypothetical protein N7491_008482 [Penicillium cf. griseofulvum]|uniref:CFEM domain-containing protein n=1 Tax=Penicillium cf. griseofulvum TaxID=2972120 RepID=A0A9W9MG76_9EURO|nr:hypothetical protein N7472_005916 [Penicillium cf. griseofulvum]KAJ5423266.1 hypothetical protein N7491_008482 [Penicillium cf. griseofulvum]KAJ5431462.1 hypothetical protein N7445_009194 [Penicillium cf. griseofulvum]
MKLTVVVLTFATLAHTLVKELPGCAFACLDTMTKITNCIKNDWSCLCLHQEMIETAGASCADEKCGPSFAEKAFLPAVKKICQN